MPKIVQCANCRKAFLGTSYTLMEHYQRCITEKIAKNKPNIQLLNKEPKQNNSVKIK